MKLIEAVTRVLSEREAYLDGAFTLAFLLLTLRTHEETSRNRCKDNREFYEVLADSGWFPAAS